MRKCDQRYLEEILRRYDEAMVAQQDKLDTAMASASTAISKSETAVEKRFDAVNEFRDQLRDQSATFMPRAESETRHASTTEKIEQLRTRLDTMEGKGVGFTSSFTYLITGVPVITGIITVLVIFLHH